MMKQRFLFLLLLLPILFCACGDLAQPAQNDDIVRAAVADANAAVSNAHKAVESSNAESPDDAIATLNAAIDALNKAMQKLSDAVKTQPSDVGTLQTAIAEVEKAIAEVKASIEKRGQKSSEQKSDEPTQPKQDEEPKQAEGQKDDGGSKEEPTVEPQKPVTINDGEYEIREIHKGSEAGTHYVILFLGDGFTKNEWEESDYNGHLNFYGHINLVKETLFELEPFKSYKNYIDIYAIAAVSNSKTDTYLQNTGMGFSNDGEQKVKLLLEKLKAQYDVSPNVMHTLINSGYQGSYGRAFFNERSFSNTSNANATIHEMCHSIGGLGDEKGNALVATNLPNISTTENVSWKQLVGFNNIKDPVQANNVYIPTNKPHNSAVSGDCIMGLNTDAGHFCEVCKYALAVKMSSVIAGHDITMYDTTTLDEVKDYDTYSALKEHLRKNSKQNEPTKQSANITDLGNGNYTLFAKGIDANTTKYDANKKGRDISLCWAATSSNLIAWWQDLYSQKGTLPAIVGNYTTADNIFDWFREIYKGQHGDGNVTGTFVEGVAKWFVGDQSGNGGNNGSYLLSVCANNWRTIPGKTPNAYAVYDGPMTRESFSSAVVSNIQRGSAGGLKMLYGTSGGHAVTLWGCDVENGIVTALYISDSDDNRAGIMRYDVSYGNGRISLSGYQYSPTIASADYCLMFLHPPA